MTGVPREPTPAPRQFPAEELPSATPLLPPGLPPRERERKRGERGSKKDEQPATGTGSKSALETINERPQHQTPSRKDAPTTKPDWVSVGGVNAVGTRGRELNDQGKGVYDVGEAPRVGKAKTNALARMLSALRR